MKLKFKMAGAFAALALVAGAVPMAVSSASAIELGQHLDHGPKWPHKSIHYVQLAVGAAAALAAIILLTRDDKPASP